MSQRCLLIADDLTGGADAGAQFAKRGLRTLLISVRDNPRIDFSEYINREVLVLNTDSRGLSPEKAFSLVSSLIKGYNKELFPVVYKKIDSTLRGNIGYEIDAILTEMNGSLCFMAPSYPEQNRILVGGIMIVGERPLALTEVARNTASPVQESHVYKLLERQSRSSVGWIDLTHVATSCERLQKAVEGELRKGTQIIVFDAVSRQDLTNVAGVGFSLERRPLFVGSAGLAEEVAKEIAPSKIGSSQFLQRPIKPSKHILTVSGSVSSITHQQLRQVEQRNIPAFQLNKSLVTSDDPEAQKKRKELSKKIANSLSEKHAMIRTTSEILSTDDSTGFPIRLKITKILASIALLAMEESKVDVHDLVLILTGGDTAQSVINILEAEGVEIEGELLEGIVKGHLIGGEWGGLTVITKAGGFGKEDALKKIIEIIETGIL